MPADLRLHQRYGQLVRTGPRHVLVSDPNSIKAIYSPSSGFNKTKFYYVQSPIVNGPVLPRTLFNMQSEKEHSELKRTLAFAYGSSSLKAMEPLVDEISDMLLRIMDVMAQDGSPIDLGKWIQ